MRIEYERLDALAPATRNPRTHNLGEIKSSIFELGFNDPPTLDERTNKLVEGHGRVEALNAMMKSGAKPPKHVQVEDDGMWKIPVVRGVSFDSDAQAERYILAHNRLVERGGWNMEMLGEIFVDLRDESLPAIGWDSKEVDRILKSLDPEPPNDFQEHGEFMNTQYCCPKCGYKWNKA